MPVIKTSPIPKMGGDIEDERPISVHSRDLAFEMGSKRLANLVIAGIIVQNRWGNYLDPRCNTVIDLHMKSLEKRGVFRKAI